MSKASKQLSIFLALTFLWTWAFYAPLAVGHHSPYEMPWQILLILGGMGPSVVGVSLVLLTCSAEQRRDYWQRCFSVKRIQPQAWLVILLLFPALAAASVALDLLLGGSLPGMEQWMGLMANPFMWPLAAFISFMSGPWSEEFGWRGYALDRFLERFGALRGSIALGLIWAVWHLPLYAMPATWHGQMGFKPAGFWSFVAENAGVALIMTWIYLASNRSILSGMLLHFTSNFTGQLIAPSSDQFEVIHTGLLLVVGLAVCLFAVRRPRWEAPLVREKLAA